MKTSYVLAVLLAVFAVCFFATSDATMSIHLSNVIVGVDDQTHYGNPYDGPCLSDEVNVTVEGMTGAFCTPGCSTFKACPTDVPSTCTAQPQCALQDSGSGKKYCALMCTPGASAKVTNDECGDNASCKPIQGLGICTYDQA